MLLCVFGITSCVYSMELKDIIASQPRGLGGTIAITPDMIEAAQRDSELEELSRGLTPPEKQRLVSAQTPDEKFTLGCELHDEKFGVNLFKDKRDQLAARLYTDSGTDRALGNLGRLYAYDRIGLELTRDQRYERAISLLKRDSGSKKNLEILGDMYRFGKYPGAREQAISQYNTQGYVSSSGSVSASTSGVTNFRYEPNYAQARVYYKQADTGYSWYARGIIHNKQWAEYDACRVFCGIGSNGHLIAKCFKKAEEKGYRIPSGDSNRVCGHYFGMCCSFTFLIPILPCILLNTKCFGTCVSDEDL